MTQILAVYSGGWCRCGGCEEGIRANTRRAYLYRGGTNAKAFHMLCALEELKKSVTYLVNNMKIYGTTKHKTRTMYQFR